MATTPNRNPRKRPPSFVPVKVRSRRDGWGPQVQCTFLAQLYLTGSVAAAARKVGRSRESAYRLRRREGGESFAAAWDHVLAKPGDDARAPRRIADWRKVTQAQLTWRVQTGFWRPVVYRKTISGIVRKPDNSGLLRLLRRVSATIATGANTRPIERGAVLQNPPIGAPRPKRGSRDTTGATDTIANRPRRPQTRPRAPR